VLLWKSVKGLFVRKGVGYVINPSYKDQFFSVPPLQRV
jgi:hypothetical protein